MTKLLLIGGTGLVGSRVVDLLFDKFDLIYPTASELDVTDENQVKQAVLDIKPELILYAAGFTNVDLAEEKSKECYSLNVKAVEYFVKEASKLKIPFYYLSTDIPRPVDSVYAKSKREGELITLTSDINGIIRLIMPFSAVHSAKLDIVRLVLEKLKKGEKLNAVSDQKINPVFVDDLIIALEQILQKRISGIYHVAATSFTNPYEFMLEIARQFNLPQNLIEKTSFAEYSKGRFAKRPQHTWLDTSKFRREFGEGILHSIEEEISLFKSQIDYKKGLSYTDYHGK